MFFSLYAQTYKKVSSLFCIRRRIYYIFLQSKLKMKKQNAPNPYAAKLTKLAYGQTATFNRNDRTDVYSAVKNLNSERNPYQFTQSLGKSGVNVTRVIPVSLSDRKLYIDSINKEQLTDALGAQNGSKEATARVFGISARSIGRMISKHGIRERHYQPAKAVIASKPAKKAVKSTKSATKNRR